MRALSWNTNVTEESLRNDILKCIEFDDIIRVSFGGHDMFKIDARDPDFEPEELVDIYLSSQSPAHCAELVKARYGKKA